MSQDKKTNLIPNWALAGHSKPKTRREFLAHGLIPFVASTVLPNPLEIIRSGSFLQTAGASLNCATTSSNSWIPVVQIDLAGGAALMANFVPKDQGGQLLPSYNRMGLGTLPPLTTVFGGASFYTQSGILAGINNQTTELIRNQTSMFGVCVQSGDDRSSNLMAVNGVLQKLGVNGDYLPHTGNVNSASAGRHLPALVPVDGPLVVNNFNALSSSLGFTRNLNALSEAQKVKLAKLTASLNASQARKLASESGARILSDIVGCAAHKNADIIEAGNSIIDPRQNPNFQTIWGINANTQANNDNLVFGSLVYNTLTKNSGSTTIQLGGYDYHGSNRATTDGRDNEAGQLIGRVLASAAALNTPVFIIVTSDGAVGSQQSDTAGSNFNSDRGSAGVLYSFIYNPDRQVAIKSNFANQLGYFESGQLASERSIIGASTERAMAAIIANYLALHNKVGELERVLNTRVFSVEELDKIILIDS